MDSLDELYRANACRRFRDCRGIVRPNWPDAQLLETAACCHLFRLEEPRLPLDRSPVSCPSEQPHAPGPVFVGRCPPGVRRAVQFHVPQTGLDPVNAAAESDDGNGSFLLEPVVAAPHSTFSQGIVSSVRPLGNSEILQLPRRSRTAAAVGQCWISKAMWSELLPPSGKKARI